MNRKRRIEKLERLAAERQNTSRAAEGLTVKERLAAERRQPGSDLFKEIDQWTTYFGGGPLPPSPPSITPAEWQADVEETTALLDRYKDEFEAVAQVVARERAEEEVSAEDLALAGFTVGQFPKTQRSP